jgi:hypothetical protein
MACKEIHELAWMARREVLDDHEREIWIGRQSLKQALQRGDAACRRADPNDPAICIWIRLGSPFRHG